MHLVLVAYIRGPYRWTLVAPLPLTLPHLLSRSLRLSLGAWESRHPRLWRPSRSTPPTACTTKLVRSHSRAATAHAVGTRTARATAAHECIQAAACCLGSVKMKTPKVRTRKRQDATGERHVQWVRGVRVSADCLRYAARRSLLPRGQVPEQGRAGGWRSLHQGKQVLPQDHRWQGGVLRGGHLPPPPPSAAVAGLAPAAVTSDRRLPCAARDRESRTERERERESAHARERERDAARHGRARARRRRTAARRLLGTVCCAPQTAAGLPACRRWAMEREGH